MHYYSLQSPALLVLLSASALAAPTIEHNPFIKPRDVNPIQSSLNPLDYAPDFSKDSHPPYPDVVDANGRNYTAANWRNTRLFGWKGCDNHQINTIIKTYNDFHKLASQDGVYKNLDWSSQAAKDIWGNPAKQNAQLSDKTKQEIQQIFQAAQQVYDPWWYPPYDDINPPVPGFGWRNLWIRTVCAPGGDPDNVCGDDPAKQQKCKTKADDEGRMEAFSEPEDKYSKITFCKYFFDNVATLDAAIDKARQNPSIADNLETYNNQARIFFHEVTHLSYFMNAPEKSPRVDDVMIKLTQKGPAKNSCYGPMRIKELAKYEAAGKGGFFTQRNADSYAWFAVAKYVEKIIGRYPRLPTISGKPYREPRDGDNRFFDFSANQQEDPDDSQSGDAAKDDGGAGFNIPSCSDIPHEGASGLGIESIGKVQPSCDNKNALSGIPYNVFYSQDTGVFAQFCAKMNSESKFELTVDSKGFPKHTAPSKIKRTPPPNPAAYDSFDFNLAWEPSGSRRGCMQTFDSCLEAFKRIASSPCGHQGGQQNVMTAAAKLALPDCGTYSYTITGPKVPKPAAPPPPPPPPPPPAPAPSLGPQQCEAAFDGHADTQAKAQAKAADDACAKANGHMISSDPSTFISYRPTNWLAQNQYQYDVTWAKDCTSSVTQLDAGKPLANDPATCASLLKNDYKNCNNGGVGGSIQVGCLKYSFTLGPKP